MPITEIIVSKFQIKIAIISNGHISINLFDILKSKRTLIFNFPWLVNLRKIYLETYGCNFSGKIAL